MECFLTCKLNLELNIKNCEVSVFYPGGRSVFNYAGFNVTGRSTATANKSFSHIFTNFLKNNAVAVCSQTYKVLLNAIIPKTNTSRPHFPVNVSSFFKIYLLHLKFF